jgi:hypothetical protein
MPGLAGLRYALTAASIRSQASAHSRHASAQTRQCSMWPACRSHSSAQAVQMSMHA